MPITSSEASEYYGVGGDFTSIKKLCKPGESVTVQLIDIVKNTRTKYPIKDKDYNYRVTMKDAQGRTLHMDLSGRDSIAQMVTALYPEGVDKALVPCAAKITRRTERKTTQSEMIVERTDGGEAVAY